MLRRHKFAWSATFNDVHYSPEYIHDCSCANLRAVSGWFIYYCYFWAGKWLLVFDKPKELISNRLYTIITYDYKSWHDLIILHFFSETYKITCASSLEHQAKTQISLHIHAVWSVSLLGALWLAKADKEDQTAGMPRPESWLSTHHCLFCPWAPAFVYGKTASNQEKITVDRFDFYKLLDIDDAFWVQFTGWEPISVPGNFLMKIYGQCESHLHFFALLRTLVIWIIPGSGKNPWHYTVRFHEQIVTTCWHCLGRQLIWY